MNEQKQMRTQDQAPFRRFEELTRRLLAVAKHQLENAMECESRRRPAQSQKDEAGQNWRRRLGQ